MWLILSLNLWCAFFTIEIAPEFRLSLSEGLMSEDWRDRVKIEGHTLDEWEELLCGQTIPSQQGSTSVPRLRLLGN